MRRDPSSDPSWEHYPHTILEIGDAQVGRAVRLDLRREPTEEARGALASLGLPGAFAVLTAANPHGVPLSDARNRGREARLSGRLSRLGIRHLRADGVSPDGHHRERGVAAPVSQRAALLLARRAGQSAFFWFDGASFWIVPALVREAPLRLPVGGKAGR